MIQSVIPKAKYTPVVLVVDDDPVNREIFRWALEPECDLTEMRNGVGVAEYLIGSRPDLVFLDLMMPIVDGFDVVDEVFARAPDLLNRVIVCSADTSQPRVQSLIDRGVAGVHARPYDEEAILALMRLYHGKAN